MAKNPTPLQVATAQADATTKQQIALIEAQRAQAQLDAQARAAQVTQFAAQLGEMLKGLGPQIQQGFQTAGNAQATFAKGYSDAQRMLQQGNADETNALLKNVVGAPSGQLIPGDRATGAADVLYGLGGAIPGRTFSEQGAAFGAAAASYPLQAAAKGQFLASQELGKGAEAAQQYQGLIDKAIGERPGLIQNALADMEKARAEAAKLASKPPDTVSGPDGLYAWQQTKKGWQLVPIGPRKQSTTAAKSPTTVYGPDGLYAWQQTPKGWQLTPVGPRKGTSTGGTSSGLHYYQDSLGREHAFDSSSGTDYLLPGQGNPNRVAKAPPGSVARGTKLVNDGAKPYYALQDSQDTRLSTSELRGILSDFAASNPDWDAFNRAGQAGSKFSKEAPPTVAALKHLTGAQLDFIGIGEYTAEPNDLYFQLIGDLKIPAKQAWQIVRKKYPDWGEGFFKPQGGGGGGGAPTSSPFGQAGTRVNPAVLQALSWDPAHPDTQAAYRVPGGTYGAGLVDLTIRQALKIGLDPAVALAIVPHEGGLEGAIGDGGNSYGPWQLYRGGALPGGMSDATARKWANSPRGVAYALRQIKKVIGNLEGEAAVEAAIRQFERPARQYIEAEIANAKQTYGRLQEARGPQSGFSQLAGNVSQTVRGVGSTIGGVPWVNVPQARGSTSAPFKPAILSFVSQIAQAYGQPLPVWDNTTHSKYTVNGRVSVHYTGNAADIPATGELLKRLGYIALVRAGMPELQARRAAATGGLFNIGGYQIIFATNTGGNHYDHLHVGIRG